MGQFDEKIVGDIMYARLVNGAAFKVLGVIYNSIYLHLCEYVQDREALRVMW